MEVENFSMEVVRKARNTLREKLEDGSSSMPVIKISYEESEFRKIKEYFTELYGYAIAYHMDVSFVEGAENVLKWIYRFERPLFDSNT